MSLITIDNVMRVEESTLDGITVYTTIYEESDFATSEQKQAWLSTCDSCEFKKSDSCGNCGCLFESLMNLATARCPIDKW